MNEWQEDGRVKTGALHVCYLCNEYPHSSLGPKRYGGLGTATSALARALVRRGHQVSVVGLGEGPSGSARDDGVRLVRLPLDTKGPLRVVDNAVRSAAALTRLHRSAPIDILEGPELSLAFVPRLDKMSSVLRLHGGHHFFTSELKIRTKALRGWVERRSFARADHLCAVSRYVGETTRRLLGLGHRPMAVIPNLVDVEHFQPPRDASRDPELVVFVGALKEKKGIRQLLLAWSQVLESMPHARLEVAGGPLDSVYARELRAALSPSARAGVRFLGHVTHRDLPSLLGRAQVCVYPSHMESLHVACLEGLACGAAVVASRYGPGPEVIEHGVSGLLCDPHDPASIATELLRALRDRELNERLGRAGRRRVEERFSETAVVLQAEAFYRACARGP